MAITVKYLEGLGVDKETAEKIFAERGAEIEKEKAKTEKLENELKESKESFDKLTSELETLKADNANGEEWKAKFEALQSETEAKAKQAEADRIMREKDESIKARFAKANEGKGEWYNNFTENGYLDLFRKALEDEKYSGMSDVDILHELSKNDPNARKGITVVKLPGGTPKPTGKTYNTKEEIMAIKDRAERRQAIAENPSLFGITNKGD